MLTELEAAWLGPHERVLDLGGGTGVMAEAIQTLLPAGKVVAVDVVDRYFPTLTIETHVYDGRRLPFADRTFEAATINNVLHHVPPPARAELMHEIARVVTGPLYIKDHISDGRLDRWRLAVLDAIGNVPFGGQIRADYLDLPEWHRLAALATRVIGETRYGRYRSGPMAFLFPNRLEVSFRFDPA